VGESRHIKFRVQIVIDDYYSARMIDYPKGVCPESRDRLNFLKIDDEWHQC